MNRRRFLRCVLGVPGWLWFARGDEAQTGPGPEPAPTGWLQDLIYERHITGPGHPESPQRCAAIRRAFTDLGRDRRFTSLAPRPATDEDLLRCHTRAYLETARADIQSGSAVLSTGDTNICRDTLDVARQAAGGVLEAVDAVFTGRVRNAFCVVRPPGHHATPGRGMGFCVFNNVALAARYAQQRHGAGKVLIVDWDVHHGNGTQEIFYEDGSVFFFSTHQYPWYPGTGAADETGRGKGRGCILNCPFPAGAGREQIVAAFTDQLAPAAARFKPELVLVSAGFDSRRGDPLGGFLLDDGDFAELTRIVMAIAAAHAGDRLVSVLEGGYALAGLASASAAHVQALASIAEPL